MLAFPMNSKRFQRLFPLLAVTLLLSSCTALLTDSVIEPAFENMGAQSDLELVCEGTPAYLLMLDSLAAGRPESTALLKLGVQAYSGSFQAMEECGVAEERLAALAEKARRYSDDLLRRLLGINPADDLAAFTTRLETADRDDAEELLWAATGLIVWIRQQQGAPAAMARLGRVELLLLKVVELDEAVESGAAHFLLGGLYGSRPTQLGGDPARSRYHFERALELSQRRLLLYQTTFAQTYARQTMNAELHQALLREVLDFPLDEAESNRLANVIAKRQARRMLAEDYFAE